MEIITIKKKALVLDEDEIAKLKYCLRDFNTTRDVLTVEQAYGDYTRFANYMIVKLEELDI